MTVTQNQFRSAIFDPASAVPVGLSDGTGKPAGKRFNVYRNNVVVSLQEALRDAFPTVQTLLGAQNFAGLSDLFLRAHPPSDPRMMHYGAEFPEFLDTLPQLAQMPYLGDMARLDQARRKSYHAADSTALDPAIFADLPPERLATASLECAPATRLLQSDLPVFDIWRIVSDSSAGAPASGPQDILITRPEYDPGVHLLPSGGAAFLLRQKSGEPLGTTLAAMETEFPDFDFAALLGLLLQSAALTKLKFHDT